MTKKTRWFTLALALGVGLGLLAVFLTAPQPGLAKPAGERVKSVAGSSVATTGCYDAGTAQVLCFTVNNASPDSEWLTAVRLTFPDFGSYGPWEVSCYSQDASDSSGNPANLDCSTPLTNEVRYDDNEHEAVDVGEITSGSSWGFCLNITVPASYNGPRIVNWQLDGDGGGSAPHSVADQTTIQECTPLMLKPDTMTMEGCNGITQTHTFELWNHSAGAGTFDLTYDVPSGNGVFTGPTSFSLSNGDVVTFLVWLVPDCCVPEGGQVTATLHASGNGESDTSTIVKTISLFSGWNMREPSPIPAMDNVVFCHEGDIWTVGGYGSNGAVQRYDIASGTWSIGFASETDITPTVEYPMDGCYGQNALGHDVIVLFPDTIVTGALHIYDITDDSWYTETVPAFYPPEGRWGQDIVSMYEHTGENVCYLSGGSPQEGGGRTRDLWEYRPDGDPYDGKYLGAFYSSLPVTRPFDFHASWYVPWVGNAGAVCVGGGIDHNHQIISSTECYDLDAGSFNLPNADLGPLPEPWWGMADGWQIRYGRYQIWIAEGVDQDGMLLPASAYADETTGGFVYGPMLPGGLYRLEGDGCGGNFYIEQGAEGGFLFSKYNHLLEQCPWCAEIYLPLVLKNYP